jgi:hypothetical protein
MSHDPDRPRLRARPAQPPQHPGRRLGGPFARQRQQLQRRIPEPDHALRLERDLGPPGPGAAQDAPRHRAGDHHGAGRWEEFELHVRAALLGDSENRLTPDELKEVLMQSAIYAGVPAANTGLYTRAGKILRELGTQIGYELEPAGASRHQSIPASAAKACTAAAARPALQRARTAQRQGAAPYGGAEPCARLRPDHVGWLANHLAADCRVIAYDHRGHGSSEAPPARTRWPTWPTMPRACCANSIPGRWCGSACRWAAWSARSWRCAIPRWCGRWCWPIPRPAIRTRRVRSGSSASPPSQRRASKRSPTPSWDATSTTASAQDSRPPWHASGAASPAPMSERIAADIPGARLETIEEASHLSAIEQPARFAALVEDFLAGL